MTDMSVTQMLFRDAEKSDARDIAALYRLAAGGVADVVWDGLREDDEDIIDTGARRFAREGEDFSYQNCAMAEYRGRPVGLLHAFPLQSDPNFDPAEVDPVLRPYAELEQGDSYYIGGIALKPDFRGRGMGTKMLRLAELIRRVPQDTLKAEVARICAGGWRWFLHGQPLWKNEYR